MASGEILGVGAPLAAPSFQRVREPPLQDPHRFMAEFLVLRQFHLTGHSSPRTPIRGPVCPASRWTGGTSRVLRGTVPPKKGLLRPCALAMTIRRGPISPLITEWSRLERKKTCSPWGLAISCQIMSSAVALLRRGFSLHAQLGTED